MHAHAVSRGTKVNYMQFQQDGYHYLGGSISFCEYESLSESEFVWLMS